MSAPARADTTPIESKAQLVEYFEAGSKPPDAWRIGTEHEKFAFSADDLRPLPYQGNPGIRDFLMALRRYGWEPVAENGQVIALTRSEGCNITLEPGGQIELSGAPVETVHETCDEVQEHLRQVREIGRELAVGMIGIGFQPKWRREDMPWMPKRRYEIMRAHMAKKGNLGHDMMLRTCTVQVNLDYADEADMRRKMRIGMALQPVATAMFANSPFVEGRLTDYQSYRAHCWTDTDPDRTGILPFVFEDGFGFEDYVDWLLDVPMYFVYRDGRYVDASGQSFRDFLDGRLPALPGTKPTIGDWTDHLTTAFPEVRLKRFIEMRGADAGPWRRVCALPALWVGLLYDPVALDATYDLIKGWSADEVIDLRERVMREGLRAGFRRTNVLGLARQVLCIARDGLKRRARLDFWGQDEAHYLATLEQTVDTGMNPAAHKAAAFNGRWGHNIARAFEEYAF